MLSLAVQTSGGCVYVDGVPLARLLVCAPQRRFGNEKGHGVLDVASSSDTKSHHRTTIGSQDAAEPGSLRSVRERLSDTTGLRGSDLTRCQAGRAATAKAAAVFAGCGGLQAPKSTPFPYEVDVVWSLTCPH